MNRQPPILSYIPDDFNLVYGSDKVLCASSFYFYENPLAGDISLNKRIENKIHDRLLRVTEATFTIDSYSTYPYLFAINFKPKYHPGLESNV